MSAIEAFLLLDLGLSDEAFAAAERATTKAELAGDKLVTAFAYNAKGVTLALCRQPELGIRLLERATDLARAGDDEAGQAFHLLNLGFCQIKLADYAQAVDDAALARWVMQAIASSEAAIEAAQRCGDGWTQRVALANAAEFQARSGRFDRAMVHLEAWHEVPGEACLSQQVHYLYTLGEVQLRLGQLEAARASCAKAVALADSGSQIDHQLNAVSRLCDVHEALGEYQSALALHRRFHTLYVRQSGETTLRRAKVAELRLESQKLRAKAKELSKQVMLDPLTGIANRRSFDQLLERLEGSNYTLGALDLDHFKKINDQYSHQVGDRVLQRVAHILVEQVGAHGHAARLGGEEFALIFPGVAMVEASVVCDTVRRVIAEADWSGIATGLRVTASIGLAAGTEQDSGRELITTADRRLYAAKRQGRNCLVIDDLETLVMAS